MGIGRGIFLRIIGLAVVVTLAGIAILGVRAVSLLNDEVGPELRANAEVIGDRVRSRIESALEIGVPLDALVGVEPYLAAALASGPGAARLTLRDGAGTVLHSVSAQPDDARADPRAIGADWLRPVPGAGVAAPVVLPVRHRGETVATLEVAIDDLFVARQLMTVTIDIAILAGIAILIAVEVLLQVVTRTVRTPLAQFGAVAARLRAGDFSARAATVGAGLGAALTERANALARQVDGAGGQLRQRVEDARDRALSGPGGIAETARLKAERALEAAGRFSRAAPERIVQRPLIGVRGAAFLFVLAEELTRPFMPLFIQSVGLPAAGGAQDTALLIAIPITAFMLGVALTGPFAEAFSNRAGRRRSFVIGALLSTAGLAWTAQAHSFDALVLSRALSGLGYALTFVACQGQVVDRTDATTRTMGMSVFVGGIMAADICGPAIGGILADQIGYRLTLTVAAAVALLAALAAILMLDDTRGPRADRPGSGWRAVGACLANGRVLAVLVLGAIPAKLVLTGFLFFLVPLQLSALGATEAEIGRVAMLYGAAALLLMPVFAGLCDRFQAHGLMVGLGALITGWALVPLAFGPSVLLITLAVLALGLAQAMSIPAQTVLVTLVGQAEMARHGPGPVLGLFRLVERLGAAAGPLVAAQAVQAMGFAQAFAAFGFFAVGMGTAFAAVFLTVGTRPADAETADATGAGP